MPGGKLTSCVSLLNFGRIVLRLLRGEKESISPETFLKKQWFFTRIFSRKKDPAPKKNPA
jgi:hypothetical protein